MKDNFFYGLEKDHLFKIYVADGALHGAKVGSYIYDAGGVGADLGPYGFIIYLLFRRSALRKVIASRALLESKYDALIPGSSEFLDGHESNFKIIGSEILDVGFINLITKPKPAIPKSFRLEFSLASGKKRRFYLIGRQEIDPIKKLLAMVVPETVLKG